MINQPGSSCSSQITWFLSSHEISPWFSTNNPYYIPIISLLYPHYIPQKNVGLLMLVKQCQKSHMLTPHFKVSGDDGFTACKHRDFSIAMFVYQRLNMEVSMAMEVPQKWIKCVSFMENPMENHMADKLRKLPPWLWKHWKPEHIFHGQIWITDI